VRVSFCSWRAHIVVGNTVVPMLLMAFAYIDAAGVISIGVHDAVAARRQEDTDSVHEQV
jgi:hypothetical protein